MYFSLLVSLTLMIFSVYLQAEITLIPKTASLQSSPKESVEYDVLGIGTAMTDLIIPVSDDFVHKHAGRKGGSSVVPIHKIEEIIKESSQTPIVKPGGSCSNTLKGLGKLGVKAAYHLRDGIDYYGEQYKKNLIDNNVCVIKVDDEMLPSGRLACLITPDKNRTFLSAPSAGAAFCPADLNPDCFKKAKIIHLDGYSLRNRSLVEESMRLAKEHGAMISFDPGCFQLACEHKDLILHLMTEYVDIVFANEDEIKILFDTTSEDACRAMSKLVKVAVVLCGNKGCLVATKDTLINVPVRNVAVVDTTGAGDLFASGFLYGLLQGYSIERCAYIGNYLGSSVIQHIGAEIPPDQWEAILSHVTQEPSFLAKNNVSITTES